MSRGSWVPTLAGWSSNPTINRAEYILIGQLCAAFVDMTVTASNSTTTTITLPFAAKFKTRFAIAVASNGSGVSGFIDLAAGSNVASIFLSSGAGLSATGNKGSTFSIAYDIQ